MWIQFLLELTGGMFYACCEEKKVRFKNFFIAFVVLLMLIFAYRFFLHADESLTYNFLVSLFISVITAMWLAVFSTLRTAWQDAEKSIADFNNKKSRCQRSNELKLPLHNHAIY